MGKYILAGMILMVFTILYMLLEARIVKVKKVKIKSDKIPESLKDLRIVFLSDIHVNKSFSKRRLGRLVKKVNKLNPDIVILGGDYVTESKDGNDENNINKCFESLKDISANICKYGVLGNHDYSSNPNLIKDKLQKAGYILLDNKAVWINNGEGKIRLGGVKDIKNDQPDILPTVIAVQDDDFTILVSHNPDIAENIDLSKIDVILSGHTHGGQVTFFGLFAPYTASKYGQKYRKRKVKKGNTRLYISHGVGTTLLPIRFFARPDIFNITFK